jgi:hypothetical protein
VVETGAFLTRAARNQHEQWVAANKEWVDASLLVPYAELSEGEKEKNRAIIRLALKHFQKYIRRIHNEALELQKQSTGVCVSDDIADFATSYVSYEKDRKSVV